MMPHGTGNMAETATQEHIDVNAAPQEAPEPSLPAIRQERRPPLPRQRAAHYPASIARAVIAITREMEAVGKQGQNEFQKYRYQRWEDINQQLSPLLAAHGLLIMQSEQSRSLLEQNDKGSVLAIVYHFTLVHESGDMAPPVEWTAIQRLRDQKGVTDDKAAAKCHTQAEKYFCCKQFKIRVAEENPENQRPTLPKKDARELYQRLQADIDGAGSEVELSTWGLNPENITRKKSLPPDWQDIITTRFNEKLAELRGGPRVVWDEETHEPFNPDTGEIIESSAPPTGDTAPAESHTTPPAGAVTSIESERLKRLDAVLLAAAQKGTIELRDEWRKLPPSDKRFMEAVKERYKPLAEAADRERGI